MTTQSTTQAPSDVTDLAKNDNNLVWLDCEMSGLDPERERLLEIAIVVTGPNLTPRIEGPVVVVHQSDALLAGMDAWNKGTPGKSGLIDKEDCKFYNCTHVHEPECGVRRALSAGNIDAGRYKIYVELFTELSAPKNY